MNARLTRRFGVIFSAVTLAGCAVQPTASDSMSQINQRMGAFRSASLNAPTLDESLAAAGAPASASQGCVRHLFRKSHCGPDADSVTTANAGRKESALIGSEADDGALADADDEKVEAIDPNARDISNFRQEGRASWYGNRFHGRRTASGERYDMYEMTAAHRSLPLLSYVRVENVSNHRSVIVKINDRGPFHTRRILDLSAAAAEALGMQHHGTGEVRITGLSPKEAEAQLRQPLLASR